MNKVPIENNPNLKRDETTNAVINTDMNEYENYLKVKNTKEKEERRISSIENDLKNLKTDINDIKNLIMGLYK